MARAWWWIVAAWVLTACGGGGGENAFVRLLGSRGTTAWTRQLGTAGADRALAVAFAPDGDLIVVGITSGSLAGQPHAGLEDLFVTRLSPADGWIAVAGDSSGAFAGPAVGSGDALVLRLEANGNEAWRRTIGTPDSDFGMGVAVAPDGGVLLAGYTFGDVGGANAGVSDGYLVRFEPDGGETWRRQLGGFGFDAVFGVVVDRLGQVTVAARTDGPLAGPHAGGSDVVVQKFDADGDDLWGQQIGTTGADDAFGVALGYEREVLVVGETDGDLDGPNAGVGGDAFVLNLRP